MTIEISDMMNVAIHFSNSLFFLRRTELHNEKAQLNWTRLDLSASIRMVKTVRSKTFDVLSFTI